MCFFRGSAMDSKPHPTRSELPRLHSPDLAYRTSTENWTHQTQICTELSWNGSHSRFALTVTFVADTFHIRLCDQVPWVCGLLPLMDGAAFVSSTIDARRIWWSSTVHLADIWRVWFFDPLITAHCISHSCSEALLLRTYIDYRRLSATVQAQVWVCWGHFQFDRYRARISSDSALGRLRASAEISGCEGAAASMSSWSIWALRNIFLHWVILGATTRISTYRWFKI